MSFFGKYDRRLVVMRAHKNTGGLKKKPSVLRFLGNQWRGMEMPVVSSTV